MLAAAVRKGDEQEGAAFITTAGGTRPQTEAEDVRNSVSLLSRSDVLRYIGVTDDELRAAGRIK